MANQAELFHDILRDLDIVPPTGTSSKDYFSWIMSDPKEFCKICVRKANELASYLDKKTTVGDLENDFKIKARKDQDAVLRAKKIVDEFETIIANESPEVVVNILDMLGSVTNYAHSIVKSLSMRESGVAYLPKKVVHSQYMRLKSGYESFVGFMKLMHPDAIGIPATIPGKSGNYSEPVNSVIGTLYRTYVKSDAQSEFIMFDSPYAAAKALGIKIDFYMDLLDMINKSDGQINGFEVRAQVY